MRADFLIVGQGLAGTLLAWEFERAGFSFAIADSGTDASASSVAAGLINPITGRRFVKTWRVDTLLPQARATYRALEAALGGPLWTELKVRRCLTDERERRIAREKLTRGELAPYVVGDIAAENAITIDGAARVDVPALLHHARERWRAQGRFRETAIDLAAEAERHELVIDCRGFTGTRDGAFEFVPWQFSKGEALEIAVVGLAPALVLHRGHAVVPLGAGRAWVGATHEPGVTDTTPTSAARASLEASARSLVASSFTIATQRAGIRVNLPDRLPAAGRHPQRERLGLVNGLGAKGALWAPFLARQWVNHLSEGIAFDRDIDVQRFFARNSSQASSR